MNKRKKSIYSHKLQLIRSSREAALAAIQTYNNPLITFKTENYIVLMIIAWTYLLHAYYRSIKIEYRYFKMIKTKKKFERIDGGDFRYWELSECLKNEKCPIDKDSVNNLSFLIGLRNKIVHRKANELDTYLSGRYQACALNYNYYLKHLFGEKYGIDRYLSYSIQFAELTFRQIEDFKESSIPMPIRSFVAEFDNSLSEDEFKSDRYSYRIIFVKKLAGKPGQADRVIEFIDPKSELAESISKEYWVPKEVERPKFGAKQVVQMAKNAGFESFGIGQHTRLWKKMDAKNSTKGYGTEVGNFWFWYQRWADFVIKYLERTAPETKISI